MKNLKEHGLGFFSAAFASVLVLLLLVILLPSKAAAIDGFTKSQIQNASFAFGSDQNTIVATIGGKTVQFKYPGSFSKDNAGNIICPDKNQTDNPGGGCQYFPAGAANYSGQDYLSLPAAQRDFCNNASQVSAVQAGAASEYNLPQLDVVISGDLSKAADYPVSFFNLNTGKQDGSSCTSVTPTQKTIHLAAQTAPSTPTAGGTCKAGQDGSAYSLTCVCTNGSCVWQSSSPTPKPTCESSSSTGFEWIICPALSLFDSIADGFNHVLDSLLTFDVTGNLTTGVKATWDIMKNIASSLLVIIMLIAIFAQAFGGGPVDAYTIRKIIPRLVAAVILMQLSWPIMIWIIEVVNALGDGVRGLISAPFGGYSNLSLENLIKPLGAAGKLTTTALFSSLIGAYAFSGLTIGGVFLLACAAVLGILIAFSVLILRNMLIVLLVMLAPIAILLWILPGTERYWKMWWSNFIKLLMLFPLIMALIYAGRVFASVAANNGASSNAGAALIATFVVFVGYFGPYFFLPQAFKWGGQMFSAIAGGTWSATKGLRNFPAKYAMNRAKEEREFRQNQRRIRLGENRSAHPRWDRLLVGGYNFTRSQGHREQLMNTERAQGRKAVEEEAQNALVGSPYERLDHQDKLDSLRTIAQGHHDARTGLDGSNPALQRWALDQLATYGDWDIISNLRDSGQVDERTWQMFVAKNISAIHQNAPHLSPQRTDLSQLGYEEFGQWKDLELSEYRRQFTGDKGANAYVRDAQTGQLVLSSDTAAQRLRMYTKAKQALADPQVRRRMTAAGIAELQGIVSDAESGTIPIGSPEVSVTEIRDDMGQRSNFAYLPEDLSTPEASSSLRRELMDSRHAPDVARQLAAKAANAPAGSTEEKVFKTILSEMRAQAIDPNTGRVTNPVARDVHNILVQAYHTQMEQRVQKSQQEAFKVGHDAAQADAEVSAEIGHGTDKIDSLNEDLI